MIELPFAGKVCSTSRAMNLADFSGWAKFATTDHSEVWIARPPGISASAHVKFTNAASAQEVRDFRRAVVRQQNALRMGCTAVAPILAHRVRDGSAYRVTPTLAFSAAVITGGYRHTGRWLYAFATALLSALAQLQRRLHASHGNLKADNVLFTNYAPQDGRWLQLTDFSARDDASVGDDLRALAHLLRGLIEHPDDAPHTGPIPYGRRAYWRCFGWDAPRWIAFCNLLNSPEHNEHPQALEHFAAALARLDPDRRHARRAPILLLSGAALALAATAAGVSLRPSSPIDRAVPKEKSTTAQLWSAPERLSLLPELADPGEERLSRGLAEPVQIGSGGSFRLRDLRSTATANFPRFPSKLFTPPPPPQAAAATPAPTPSPGPGVGFEKKGNILSVRAVFLGSAADAPTPLARGRIDYIDPADSRRHPLLPDPPLPLPGGARAMTFLARSYLPVTFNLTVRPTMEEGRLYTHRLTPVDCTKYLDQANALYAGNEALRTIPNAARLGRLCKQLGLFDRGKSFLAAVDAAVKISPETAPNTLKDFAAAAREMYLAGDQRAARKLWDDITLAVLAKLAQDPPGERRKFDGPLGVLVSVGIAAAESGDFPRAAAVVTELKNRRGNQLYYEVSEIYEALAGYCLRHGQYEQAADYAQQHYHPHIRPPLIADAALGLLRVGRVEPALKLAHNNRMAPWDQRDAVATLVRAGQLMEWKHNPDGAERFFIEAEQAAGKHPDDSWRNYLRGVALLARGWYQSPAGALAACREALRLRKKALGVVSDAGERDLLPGIAALLAWQGATDDLIPVLKELPSRQALLALLFVQDAAAREQIHAALSPALGSYAEIDRSGDSDTTGNLPVDLDTFAGWDAEWMGPEVGNAVGVARPAEVFARACLDNNVHIAGRLVRFFARTGQSDLLRAIRERRPQDLNAEPDYGEGTPFIQLLAAHGDKLAEELCVIGNKPADKLARLLDFCDGRLDYTDGANLEWDSKE